ncbi:MAG: type II toxin-antitoxin system VapC family toxin [Acidobacteria bacterium]|nr:MAG: type II toxin-antitoxin system VapC family toxin [Acidobacteriota bacterium]
MAFLLDTCVWIDVERAVLAPGDVAVLTRGEEVYLSPVTLAELRFGAEIAAPALRQQRLAALARIETRPLLSIDRTTGLVFGSLTAQLHLSAHRHRARVQDLWLASQAIQHGCSLLTRNVRDFDDLPGLQVEPYALRPRPS